MFCTILMQTKIGPGFWSISTPSLNTESTKVCTRLCILLLDYEDIYTAAGWESIYQHVYLHGSLSIFSTKSAIYTAVGYQHKIAICTAALPEPIQLYSRLLCVHIKSLLTRQSFKSQISYKHCCRVYKPEDQWSCIRPPDILA